MQTWFSRLLCFANSTASSCGAFISPACERANGSELHPTPPSRYLLRERGFRLGLRGVRELLLGERRRGDADRR